MNTILRLAIFTESPYLYNKFTNYSVFCYNYWTHSMLYYERTMKKARDSMLLLKSKKIIRCIISVIFFICVSFLIINSTTGTTINAQSDNDIDAQTEYHGPVNPYTPYGQYVSYQYQINGSQPMIQDVIREYQPDSNGIFQVAMFTVENNSAICQVYQIRDQGIYLLASYDNYYDVEDLRNAPTTLSQTPVLVLPSNIQEGMSYASSADGTKIRTVVETSMNYEINDVTYQDVVKIEEEDLTHSDYVTNYYYAPAYGLIVVERVNQAGESQILLQIMSAQ